MNYLKKLIKRIMGKEKKARGAKKSALCIGINDYPGRSNDLKGCVNDSKVWASLLKKNFGYSKPLMLKNKQATVSRVSREMKKMIMLAKAGDSIVIQFSGHGTSVPDRDGDEKDGRDEAICLYDGLLLDDEICKILKLAAEGVKLAVITDCCHSGTITRSFSKDTDKDKAIRYLPPLDDSFAEKTRDIKVLKKAFRPHSEVVMNEVLITGCKSTEYSYDAKLGGKYYGAMTYYSWQIIKNNPCISYDQFYVLLKKKLPSKDFPQSPQLEGRKENTNRSMFS